MKPKFLVTFLIFIVFVTSCSKTTPAGFWTTFHKDRLVKNICDQGPRGGHQELYWKATTKNSFTRVRLIEFAEQNGWQLVDSTSFPADTLKKWHNNEQTFPFTYTDFADKSMNTATFPRWITSDIKLYRFKTGWIAVEPGNARETEKNGYILLNLDGTEFSVYHLWGE